MTVSPPSEPSVVKAEGARTTTQPVHASVYAVGGNRMTKRLEDVEGAVCSLSRPKESTTRD